MTRWLVSRVVSVSSFNAAGASSITCRRSVAICYQHTVRADLRLVANQFLLAEHAPGENGLVELIASSKGNAHWLSDRTLTPTLSGATARPEEHTVCDELGHVDPEARSGAHWTILLDRGRWRSQGLSPKIWRLVILLAFLVVPVDGIH